MSKRINYKEGDLITIPLTDSRKAICKIIFAPKGMLKQVICCTLIGIQQNLNLGALSLQNFISIHSNPRNTKSFFTGNQMVKNGNWAIVGNTQLSDNEKSLQWFVYAGELYHKEELIRHASEEDYKNYVHLEVMGFVLVDTILTVC